MTQAFNLSQFANKLNSSGQTDNTGLQNNSVTVTAGTGMSGGGSVALGGSTTLTNAGVTSVAAGTGISVSASTGSVTISASGTGTVTSVATGNGLSGGTITTTGTLTVACPSFNSVGSYANAGIATSSASTLTAGSNYSAGTGNLQIQSGNGVDNGGAGMAAFTGRNALSGTWKYLGITKNSGEFNDGSTFISVVCRVS